MTPFYVKDFLNNGIIRDFIKRIPRLLKTDEKSVKWN
jgi:hypothetical protein